MELAVENNCCLLRYLKPRMRGYRENEKNKFMTKRISNKEGYEHLPFQCDELYAAGIAPDKKIEIVAAMLVTGSAVQASKATGITESSIRNSARKDWYRILFNQMSAERGLELKVKCNNMIDELIGSISDRMKKGDEKIGKTGEIVNIAVSARDSAYILGVIQNHKERLYNGSISSGVSDETAEMLKRISEAFEKVAAISMAKDITPDN